MTTTLYFVRHCESPYIEGQERSRGISAVGEQDAMKIVELLRHMPMGVFASSPYARAIQTIQPLADMMNLSVQLHEDLRERQIGVFEGMNFHEAKRKVYEEFTFSFPDGESSLGAQQRAVTVLQQLINEYDGHHIVLGTHGDIMTLIMNYFDPAYGFEFWGSTTMPDIYKLELEGMRMLGVTRLWQNKCT
ncbi:histidine phosphatase family protein [Paenibacillus alvei]|uniref:histidine phosphatase family protein n=1 Tax=Paenibacillus alvei TaxID=44250 RepID=UPI00227DDBCB|nr:histidine phosphatase family protein [Paenibacillus alvei]MCY7483118.1 histidine phosphatase family protein [Paenibacillus alvei]